MATNKIYADSMIDTDHVILNNTHAGYSFYSNPSDQANVFQNNDRKLNPADAFSEPFGSLVCSALLRGCLKKIDKIAFSMVFGVVSLSGSGKSGDFEQKLVWLNLNSQF